VLGGYALAGRNEDARDAATPSASSAPGAMHSQNG
jgi:hypothetical protein